MNAIYSELHSRLNHLVNYSSQLIFVSSESIAEQHRTLEAFMADQSELTEVAFVTASADDTVVAYRRQLCRQLIGQVAGSFVRPLNELLVSLNHHDGPVLIGITQAHFLPNSFLQELWDLVLQSRFAANKQHLNIVLFGDSQWAEDAQAWLPAKNTATPLLLSSESIDNVETELEQLISQKRAAFQQRLAHRYQEDADPTTQVALIRKPWFSLLVIAVFGICFATLLGWQYPERMQALLGLNTAEVSERPTPDNQLGEALPLTGAATEVIPKVSESTVQASDMNANLNATAFDTVDLTLADTQITEAEVATLQTESITDQLLVTRWGAADKTVNSESARAQSEVQLPAETATIATTTADIEAGTVQPVVIEPAKTATTDNAWPTLPPLTESQYLIQIAGLQDINLALQYLEDQKLLSSVWLYKTQRYGGDWYVIVHNQTYTSFNQAQSAIANLPNYQRESPPFVKSSKQINNELNQ